MLLAPHNPEIRASILILNWNTRQTTLDCIASVKQHHDDLPIQIVVIDNGSSDGSADAFIAAHPDITLVRSRENLGFSRGNNLGFPHAVGQYIFLLNSDTLLLPGALKQLVDYLDANPRVGAAGGQQLDATRRFSPSGSWFPNVWRELSIVSGIDRFRFWFLDNNVPISRLFFATETGPVDWLPGSFLALRREMLEEVGLLPTEFFMYGEDIEWCWRMKEAGWGRAYVHGAPIIHLERRSADTLFRGDTSLKILDAMGTFATRHRNPIAWRVSWTLLAGYWAALAVRWRLRGRLGDPKAEAIAASLEKLARRHFDHIMGRVPDPKPPVSDGPGT